MSKSGHGRSTQPQKIPSSEQTDGVNVRRGRTWTQKEDKEVVALHGEQTISVIALQLGRSEGAVRSRLKHLRTLGHKLPQRVIGPRTGKRWTDNEHARLIELSMSKTIEEIAEELGRTPLAIGYRIVMLSKDSAFLEDVVNQAQSLVDVDKNEGADTV